MAQRETTRSKGKKNTWLIISIISLGYIVVFGLGFTLGLNFGQNLYLVKQEPRYLQPDNKKNDDTNDLSFYYGLKEKRGGALIKAGKSGTSEHQPEKTVSQTDGFKAGTPPKREVGGLTDNLGHTIQVYSFRSKEISSKMVSELRKKGYSAYQSKIDLGKNDVFFRVRVGRFKNRSEALGMLKRICESENKDAFITIN